MAGIITTAAFAKKLYPGVSKWWDEADKDHPEEWRKLVDVFDSKRAYEEDVQEVGLGLAAVKRQGAGISYDTMRQGFVTRYEPKVYALGYIFTREMMEDNLYRTMGPKRTRALNRSLHQTKEQVVANMYNRGTNSTYAGGDGKELLATDHPHYTGGTYANELSTASDLSEAALEQVCINIGKYEDDRGLKINVMVRSLHIPVDLSFEAERFLMSPYRPETANNDINALYAMGKFPGGVHINHWFSSTTAWFVRTDVPADEGLKLYQRRKREFGIDNEWETENARFKASERWGQGWTNPRALYGSGN